MEFFFAGLGISSDLFAIVVLPLLIFFARIIDVSINTVRIIFVMTGRKGIATILGFLESLVWLLAIGQIFKHLDNIYSYIAYPAGFAAGIYVGMRIEEKLALGKVVVRIISSEDIDSIVTYLNKHKFKYSIISGESDHGEEKILFTVLKREALPGLKQKISEEIPTAFYTVESVKSASETGLVVEKPNRRRLGSWLASVKRK
ncbi:DUF2179 domain-containing protein [Fulvivirga sp. RKSG066]|uniref:DUF2179 domain-containing protein n=1 Tax=Fulvivirga aurantia TaxID=2529383 RepID=UPI0012BD1840|nr:DUF5698 domain-containing protein [Fulvivirga aurantia]MTI23138.1 DUF2179 domain-containing protein [Fulvivirga aurantia]